jgi:LysM repeat protein
MEGREATSMNMREKYDHAIQVAKGLRMQGSADEKNGKLYFNGVVKSEDEKNQIWSAIKTVSSWQGDVVADIRVEAAAAKPAAAAPASKPPETYTVKAGDSLSKIAKEHLGNANAYMAIFNANRDILTDPDKIKPGMVLKLPVAAS